MTPTRLPSVDKLTSPLSTSTTKTTNTTTTTTTALNDGDNSSNQEQMPFNFPFTPYDIQRDLMKVAYDSFENAKFALLESPTGTGKTLTLICSSLTWLRDHQKKTKENFEKSGDELMEKIEQLRREEDSSGDWLSAQTKRVEISRNLAEINKQLERLCKFEEKSEARRHAKLHGVPIENYSTLKDGTIHNKSQEAAPFTESKDNIIGGSEASNHAEIAPVVEEDMEKKVAQQDEDHIKPKIYYASRTHSQLGQFVNEIKRTKFADLNVGTPIKVAALASRANLCVNPEVLKLKDSNAINEKCMEMQKETKPEKRCSYIKAKQVNMLKDEILTTVHDIEDLVSRGRTMGSCPYYASRMAIPEAELVVLPYNNLLHRETRQASSLDLKDNIVIVDEAHNILETICSIHSTPITGLQLVACHTIFSRYFKKYSSRMSPRNVAIIRNIVQCLTAIIRYLNDPRKHIRDYENPKAIDLDEGQNSETTGSESNGTPSFREKNQKFLSKHEEFMIDISKFIGSSNMERFNVFKIIDYLNRSQLARKLIGFFRLDSTLDLSIELYEPPPPPPPDKSAPPEDKDSDLKSPKRKKKKTQVVAKSPIVSTIPPACQWELTSLDFVTKTLSPLVKLDQTVATYPVYNLIEFFRSLTSSFDDGKILTDYHKQDLFKSSLKFVLLNPASQFKQMTDEARSIILAGGTMQPFDEFVELLFGPLGVDEKRLTLFSCGHVISSSNLHVASLAHGPTGKQLELSYKVKNSLENIDEIGRAIMNISVVVPGGMVCFLPSYDYEHLCFTRWAQLGIISKIETRSKHVFREPRISTQLRPVWDEYSRMIEKGQSTGRGALLFCVVGGKMSEGINFNDDLGRCVVMVGLPYANIKSVELQQKMSYYDRTCKKTTGSSPGQKYYENLCMKGINQSIGRAIRHKNDYAAIVLLDHRYSSKTSIKEGLPHWMRNSLTEYERFGPLLSQLKVFYDNIKRKCETND